MRALVTGAAGFIGGALAARLVSDGHTVFCPVRNGSPPPGSMAFRGDLRNHDFVNGVVNSVAPDVIFHLAARAIVADAVALPWSSFDDNIRPSYNLLDCARRLGCRVIVASSDKAYGVLDGARYVEDSPLAGRGPYDCGKSCTDLIAQSYAYQYGLRVGITRLGNVYGPGDRHMSRIVPWAVQSILDGVRPSIRSDGSPVRDYLFIDDAVEAYLALDSYVSAGGTGPFNFSGGTPASVSEVVAMIVECFGELGIDSLPAEYLSQKTNEIPRQVLDTTRARDLLKWQPATSLRDGLRRTVALAVARNKDR